MCRVTADGSAQAAAEAALRFELARLLGKRALQRRAGEDSAIEEDLTQPTPRAPLFDESLCDVLLDDEPAENQQLAQAAASCGPAVCDERVSQGPAPSRAAFLSYSF
jgi:hypothetical protein